MKSNDEKRTETQDSEELTLLFGNSGGGCGGPLGATRRGAFARRHLARRKGVRKVRRRRKQTEDAEFKAERKLRRFCQKSR